MTGIKGNYDATVELSLAGTHSHGESRRRGYSGGRAEAEPGDGATHRRWHRIPAGEARPWRMQCNSMGLKLESRKAMVDQFIVDHIEKTPTEN